MALTEEGMRTQANGLQALSSFLHEHAWIPEIRFETDTIYPALIDATVCIDGMLACRRLTLSYRPRSADGLDYGVVGMLGLVIDTPMPNLIRIILEVDTCNIVQDVGAPVKPRPLYLCGAGRSTLGLMRFKPDNFQFPASAVQSLIEVTVLVQDPCGIISCVKHMKTLLDILGPRGRCPGKNWGILTYRSYPKLDITS